MVKDIVEKIVNGDVRVAAKLTRDIDDRVHGTRDILKALTPGTRRERLLSNVNSVLS